MMKSIVLTGSLVALATIGCSHPAPKTAPAPTTRGARNGTSPSANAVAGGGATSDSSKSTPTGPRPYPRVITKEAKTRVGMFKTHIVGDKLYFEIPAKEMNHDMLMVGRFERSAVNAGDFDGYGGDQFTERTLRWERSGNRVILRSPSFAFTADSTLPVYRAVQESSNPAIVAIFPVEAYGPDSAAVIDVTRLYTTGVPEFASSRGSIDEKRSFIERAVAFPENVEVEATQTATPPPPTGPTPGGPGGGGQQAPRLAQSVVAHWSMVHLPDHPMMPRYYDDRVGYFSAQQIDFGTDQHRSVPRSYITRYRLEKKDPNAALSEPVKQIVYYVDPATPKKWVPYIKAGIEEWEPAFEAAGFKNAIVAKDAPSAAEDPDWSPEDIRHTVVRWLPSTVENSVGPHVHDPRTGEILNGSVRMFHNILNLQRDWYFTQVAPLDPRAQHLPFPDSLMGELVQFVVAHEVGHTLGFQHNMKASAEYPADSIHSATWVAKMGHSPSIMDYARFNYVAQPEDHIALHDLIPRVGTYDRFAVMWGYTPIPSAHTPEEERPTLDMWARQQDSIPWYRFSTSNSNGADPGEETEAVGDADPVKSTALGLKNIKRIMPMLMTAGVHPADDNDDLTELYTRLIGQWSREVGHVANVVGGSSSQEKYGNQPGARFTPYPRDKQRAAMEFINDNVFKTPQFFIDPALLRRIEPSGAMTRIRNAQAAVLTSLLNNQRMARLIEYNAMATDKANTYSLRQELDDIRGGIWTEVSAPSVRIDAFRRNLQYAYLDQVGTKINGPFPTAPAGVPPQFAAQFAPPPDEARGLLRNELLTLDSEIRSAIPRAGDPDTRAHLIDARHRIDVILYPNNLRQGGG
ncbi:MAG: zinc-dependent metalloprotease [Gemmatimonadaceae bacterium]